MANAPAVLTATTTSGIDYAKELNPQQLQAATSLNGHYLVIAGAGSGKTRTLVYRVAYLIEQGIAPQSILLLTFTRKAAQEMLSRAATLLDASCLKIVGGTFHAYAYQVLRRYAQQLGYADNFTVMDTADAESLIKMVLHEPEFVEQKQRLPKATVLASLISKSANTGWSLPAIIAKSAPQYKHLATEIGSIAHNYRQQKIQKSLMDFDDLLLYLKQLLQDNRVIGPQLANAHQYIMVDEYQDTNQLQAEIVALLAKVHGNLLVVGDDSQSIYSFRGANFKNIMAFPQMFPDCQIITLEQNYRSTQPILTFSNAVLNRVKEKYSKRLFSDILSEQKPLYIRPQHEADEATIICQAIQQLQQAGLPLGDIAILFRAASHSHHLEIALTQQAIPFIKYGGIRFAESAHIKDLLALLNLIRNPRDAIAWNRILVLMDGLGAKTAAEIIREAVDHQRGYDVLVADQFSGKKYASALAALWQTIHDFQAATTTLSEKITPVLNFYLPFLSLCQDSYFFYHGGSVRLANKAHF